MEYQDYLLEGTPKLNISKTKIVIDSQYQDTGSIKIDNIAGGFLRGKIVNNDDFIELSCSEIDKNLVDLNILVNFDKLEKGKKYTSIIHLLTNGGDKEILVEVICEQGSYRIDNLTKFYSEKDIYFFSQKNIDTLANVFVKKDFSDWIGTLGIDVFEKYKFVSEIENIYKRIDDFFILLGFKANTIVNIIDFDNIVNVKPYQKENIIKNITLRKSDSGYCDCVITTREQYKFLSFDKKAINSNEFDENDEACIKMTIDVSKLSKTHQNIVFFVNGIKHEILIKKITDIVVTTDRSIYKESDIGYITIDNKLEAPLEFTVSTTNKNITIIDSTGIVEKEKKVAFKVNFTAFNKNIVKFFKQPYFDGEINIEFKAKDFSAKRNIYITLATENLEIK